MWQEEIKEKFENDPVLVYRPNEIDVAYQFNGNYSYISLKNQLNNLI
jgi:hypothetical protein